MKINGKLIIVIGSVLFISSIIFLIYTSKPIELEKLFVLHTLIGFVVAFLFLVLLLRFFRPLIAISPDICEIEHKYIFKLVNKSIYHAFDCKFELFVMEPLHHTGARSNIKITPVLLKTSNLTILPRNRKKDNPNDPFSQFAHTFFTLEDISPYLNNGETYLELHVNARHGLTGLADTFKQQFSSETVIHEDCKFCYGNDLGVMPKAKIY